MSGVLVALAVCAVAAVSEGLLAGPGVKRRLAEIRRPRYSPPFGAWVVIGLCYDAICFVVLSRLLGRPSSWHEELAVGSLVLLLSGNALWSFLFFRRKNLEGSVLLSAAYIPVAVGLAVLLFNVDPPAGWVFLPYVLYLPYASWWMVRTWRLNRGAGLI